MQVSVVGSGLRLTAQIRAYVEYRMFCDLVRFNGQVKEIAVSLVQADEEEGIDAECQARVILASGDEVKVSAAGRHLYAAIDRAARRLVMPIQAATAWLAGSGA